MLKDKYFTCSEETFRKISKGSSLVSMNQFDPSVVFYPNQVIGGKIFE